MRSLGLILAFCAALTVMHAQTIEEWVEAASDPDDLQAWLDDLRREPLDLNSSPGDMIARLPLMDATAAQALVERRRTTGEFRSMDEALATPGLSEDQRASLLEFSCVKFKRHPAEVRFTAGTADAAAHALDSKHYWGKSNARVKTAESSGFVEARRKADDPSLLDQTSAGMQIVQSGAMPTFALGDFQYEAGTGLVFASSYGMANWLSAPGDARLGKAKGLSLRPATDRRAVFRGVAIQSLRAPLEVTLLGSWNRLDGAITDGQADELTEGQSSSDELDPARRDQIEERLYGVSISGGAHWWHAGAQGYQAHFSPAFHPSVSDPYIPQFGGSVLRTGSVCMTAERAGLSATAEAARSNPGGGAYQAAVSAKIGRSGLTLYHIYADADFYSPHGKLWAGSGEEAANRQCTGIRVFSAWERHSLALSASAQQTPFRTSTAPLGTEVSDVEARWTSSFAAPVEIEVLGARSERDETSNAQPARRMLTERGRFEARWQAHEEFRIRYEVRSSHYEGETAHQLGTLLFVQMQTSLMETRITARVTFFGLEDEGGTPMAVFESSMPGAYPLVSLSGAGRRFALTLARSWNHVTASAKVSQMVHRANGQELSAAELAVGLTYEQ